MSSLVRAVVVGINEYQDVRYRDQSLLFAGSDAEAIAQTLRASTEFRIENITLLIDGQATNRAVRESLSNIFSSRSYDSNTIAIFYFAGHGLYNHKTKRVSLACYDIDFSDHEHGGIRLNDIYDLLASSSCECAIAIIDACFSGGIVNRRVDYLSAAEHAKQAIEALRGPDGKTMAILAACTSDQQAREKRSLRHGFFTYHILRGWRDGEAKDNHDGVVTLLGLSDFLHRMFEDDWQKPKISILGSRTIALWRSPLDSIPQNTTGRDEPTVTTARTMRFTPPQSHSTTSTQSSVRSAHNVYVQAALPQSVPARQPSTSVFNKRLLLIFGIILLAFFLCGLSMFLLIHAFIH